MGINSLKAAKSVSDFNRDVASEPLVDSLAEELDLLEKDSEETEQNLTPETKVNRFDDKQTKSYVIQSKSYYTYIISCYIIEKAIRDIAQDLMTVKCKKTEFEYDFDKRCNIVFDGTFIFTINNKIFTYTFDSRSWSHTVSGTTPIYDVYRQIEDSFEKYNPLKRKHIQLIPSGNGFTGIFKQQPKTTFNDLIIPNQMKEDINDNTIFQLKNLNENNGIILYGPPGCGKSLACQAIINEAINEGYSTCFLTTQVNYTQLNEFVDRFLAPCVMILEDMDSFGRERADYENVDLSEFLQFLSGLSESRNRMIFVGTTNHIDMLDSAIANRPVRFNRKFHFDYPGIEEIDHLIDLYFKDQNISKEQKSLCYDIKFTGSHVKEVNRTAKLLSLKRKVNIKEVFDDAVKLVKENFNL
jgi:chromosomal replication initiation ATPase DnaA